MRLGLLVAVLVASGGLSLGVGAQSSEDPARRAASDLGLRIDPSKPLDITADEFEAARLPKGADLFTFRGGVRATQEDLELVCDWLEARYAKQGGAAERIVARGDVRMSQAGSEITCGELVYDSPACLVTCKGADSPATATRGDDTIRGDRIEVNLCDGKLTVKGAASIALRPQRPSVSGGDEGE